MITVGWKWRWRTYKALGDVFLQLIDQAVGSSLEGTISKKAEDVYIKPWTSSTHICEEGIWQQWGTDGDVLIRRLSAIKVVLGEELEQLWLDTTERLMLPVKQHHQVWHGESLTHQHQQLSKKSWA